MRDVPDQPTATPDALAVDAEPAAASAAVSPDTAPEEPATLDRLIVDAALEAFAEEARAAGPGWTPPADGVVDALLLDVAEVAVPRLVAQTAADVVAGAGEPDGLRQEQARRAAFRDAVHTAWGDALDSLEVLVVAFEEIGVDHLARALGAARREPGHRTRALAELKCHVLAGLHGRACRTAREVLSLLEDGLADGAFARTRTLHELTVVAAVLAKHDGALAMRYDLHGVVVTAKSMRQFDDHHAALKWEPVEPALLAAAETQAAALVDHFGPAFRGEVGWAHGVVPRRPKPARSKEKWDLNATLGLADLEHAVGLPHFRAFFGWASDSVHAGRPGLHSLGNPLGAPATPYLRGSVHGLSDPGQHAALSLAQFTAALGEHVATGAPLDGAVRAGVIRELVVRCQAQFVAADDAVRARAAAAEGA